MLIFLCAISSYQSWSPNFWPLRSTGIWASEDAPSSNFQHWFRCYHGFEQLTFMQLRKSLTCTAYRKNTRIAVTVYSNCPTWTYKVNWICHLSENFDSSPFWFCFTTVYVLLRRTGFAACSIHQTKAEPEEQDTARHTPKPSQARDLARSKLRFAPISNHSGRLTSPSDSEHHPSDYLPEAWPGVDSRAAWKKQTTLGSQKEELPFSLRWGEVSFWLLCSDAPRNPWSYSCGNLL